MSWGIIVKAFKNADMRKRFLLVAAMILVFRALSFIPIPLDEPAQLRQLLDGLLESQQLLGFLDLLSGGALSNFSIVLMGLGPFINASIIMQLLQKAVPKFEELQKEGESGRRKLNQYTRSLTLPLAVFQSVGILLLVQQQVGAVSGIDLTAGSSAIQWLLMITALTGGSMLLMWLGELMTEQGIGNGISLLIFAGIISQLPAIMVTIFSSIVISFGGAIQYSVFGLFTVPVDLTLIMILAAFLLVSLMLVYFVVKLNEARRIITVSYAKRVRGNRAYGGVDSVLPVKLIIAGVIPIIFALAFLSVPSFLGQIMMNMDSALLAGWGANLVSWFQVMGAQGTITVGNPWIYPTAYFLLVILFTYFYTGIVFNANQIAENLQNQGGFIAGIRPGKQTEEYLKKIVSRLNLVGSMSLGFLAVTPFVAQALLGTDQLTVGGTGVLIVVSVAIESLRQIESRALMITYDQNP